MPTENYKDYELNTPQLQTSEKGWREVRNFKKLIDKDESLQGQISQEITDRKDADNVVKAQITSHVSNKNNPHEVTKSQVGLGNVDNIKQATKEEFNTHNNDNVRHITAEERAKWNANWNEKDGKYWVENKLKSIQSGLWKFVGIISANPPEQGNSQDTNHGDGTLWYIWNGTGNPPDLLNGAFWDCYILIAGVWSDTANTSYGVPDAGRIPDVAEDKFQLWANRNDNHGYYRFDYSWNLLDATIDLSDYYTQKQINQLFLDLQNKLMSKGKAYSVNVSDGNGGWIETPFILFNGALAGYKGTGMNMGHCSCLMC